MQDFNSILLCTNTKFMELIKKTASSLFGSDCSEENENLINCTFCNILWEDQVKKYCHPASNITKLLKKLVEFDFISMEKSNPLTKEFVISGTEKFHKTFDKSLLLDFHN